MRAVIYARQMTRLGSVTGRWPISEAWDVEEFLFVDGKISLNFWRGSRAQEIQQKKPTPPMSILDQRGF
jgi:hypothetical protein